mmetsp:Transcript_1887/g.4352  ORF Transcript_1887/g.4352 Transcript_1887/m.4352 type:complete len:119 (+) Transcript_1887:226-582(+)|eukprot:CAMPEP_0178996940 /NCGR_PEP_ID=MMETSP0795-20121207/8654_1 /TAXON_ID=88552 /ORGANISM="Amoebophrya sp., Strain Ameob2" /LENGTH=118 /DNA_ID=CAMNT_0020689399 /DNA_START=212 /DNA_END=568 /DNA_ORIENTATION=-
MPSAEASFGGIVPGAGSSSGAGASKGLTRLPTDEFLGKPVKQPSFNRQFSSASTVASLTSTATKGFGKQGSKEDLGRGQLKNRLLLDLFCCRRCRQRSDDCAGPTASNVARRNTPDRI